MPEGHVTHGVARALRRAFRGTPVLVDSPQGRFTDSAALVSGCVIRSVEAHGKHLFIRFDNRLWIHVHLGLFGRWTIGSGDAPDVVGQIRLRIRTDDAWAELRGATTCRLLTDEDKHAAVSRIGPDPLRTSADPEAAWLRVSRSRAPIAALLMDQRVFAGVGNIYRAEILFRHRINPYRQGSAVRRKEFDGMWTDLMTLMADATRRGVIDTVRPEHSPKATGRAPRVDRHGGEVYVYRRDGQPCHVCGTAVSVADLNGRRLYWCPRCQRR